MPLPSNKQDREVRRYYIWMVLWLIIAFVILALIFGFAYGNEGSAPQVTGAAAMTSPLLAVTHGN